MITTTNLKTFQFSLFHEQSSTPKKAVNPTFLQQNELSKPYLCAVFPKNGLLIKLA